MSKILLGIAMGIVGLALLIADVESDLSKTGAMLLLFSPFVFGWGVMERNGTL